MLCCEVHQRFGWLQKTRPHRMLRRPGPSQDSAPPLQRELAPLGDVLPHFHLSQHGFTHEGQEDLLAPQEVHDAHHGLAGAAQQVSKTHERVDVAHSLICGRRVARYDLKLWYFLPLVVVCSLRAFSALKRVAKLVISSEAT